MKYSVLVGFIKNNKLLFLLVYWGETETLSAAFTRQYRASWSQFSHSERAQLAFPQTPFNYKTGSAVRAQTTNTLTTNQTKTNSRLTASLSAYKRYEYKHNEENSNASVDATPGANSKISRALILLLGRAVDSPSYRGVPNIYSTCLCSVCWCTCAAFQRAPSSIQTKGNTRGSV